VGEEHRGFKIFMNNFNGERIAMAAQACAFADVCLQEALAWCRQRMIFGSALSERQVVRHKLMDMAMRIDASRALIYDLAYRIEHKLAQPQQLVARVCLAKVQATQTMQFCADQAVQLLGGMGFMRGTKVERIYREVKVMMIGGGAEEIMKDLAARQLGV
jgi:acyl-CoA dehydrogenase